MLTRMSLPALRSCAISGISLRSSTLATIATSASLRMNAPTWSSPYSVAMTGWRCSRAPKERSTSGGRLSADLVAQSELARVEDVLRIEGALDDGQDVERATQRIGHVRRAQQADAMVMTE